MLAQHKEAFFTVATNLNCWIGLREPNELSDRYIGRGGYCAKNEKCKAKSADRAGHRFAGLVVSPELCPEAFLPANLKLAIEKWKGFEAKLPHGFSVITTGMEKGLVKYDGKSIHADFDLMYVGKADGSGKMIFTSQQDQEKLLDQVKPALNKLLGTEMIQHGAEFGWTGGVGARESEQVFSFGPKRSFRIDQSSMPTAPGTMH